ncbi:MAG: NAD(P)/FAD-dependent oxidoreductase [Deltaproteobacteria bacterium]|nr:NAD(P)/FAD-dependent oxidoreductase [Deltaproteobacteria bacterium]
MKADKPEKGAILQRDKETYAIAPHMPGGVTTPAYLRKIADVAEKYNAKALKVTSSQRIAIVGLAEENLDRIWEELGEKPGAAIGLCVRSIKMCPGTTFCKRGQQDSLKVGLHLDEKYHAYELPWKFKMGVSGCIIDCGEVCIKDVGLIGGPKGWNVMVGGHGGPQSRLSQRLLENVSEEQALQLIGRIVEWFKAQNKKGRLGKLIEEVGFDNFKAAVLPEA